MGLHFTRLILLMPYVYVMAGFHHTYHLTVFAAKPFQFPMLLTVCTVPFPSRLRHNDGRDLTAKLMSKVCHDVQVEPHLQPLSSESLHYKSAVHEDDARVDIRAAGFWNCRHHRSFFDARVFNAFAESNLSSCPTATFRRHEGDITRNSGHAMSQSPTQYR